MNYKLPDLGPSLDEFCHLQAKWNSNEEVARILYSARNHPEWLSENVHPFPPSSSQKLFKRLDGVHFKQDGYEWKKRKEGKLIREDHVKLKVQKKEIIAGSYVHSAVVPSFHRRIYWLFEHPEIVLVHYLNLTSEETCEGQPLYVRIARCIRSCGLNFNNEQIEQQLRPIFCYTLHPMDLTKLLAKVISYLPQVPQSQSLLEGIDQIDYINGYDAEELGNVDHSSSSRNTSIERSSSYSFSPRHILPSSSIRRQTSTLSDTADHSPVLGKSEACNHRGSSFSVFQPSSLAPETLSYAVQESGSVAGVPVTTPESFSTQYFRTVSQHKKSSNDSDHSATNHSSHLIDIVDFAPDQCFTAGGAKVLFIGGWYLRGHDYSVMFDDRLVKATLVHPGVLRCFTPPHQAGIVKVEVYCDGKLGSHSAYFEYVEADLTSKQSLAISELSQRMSHLQASLTGCQVGSKTELTGSNTEQSFMKIVRDLMQRPVNYSLIISSSTPTSRQHTGNNILHLCSLLNFHQLLGLLLEWRTKIPTHVYIRDLDVTARDTEGRIPLHLAAFNEYLQCVHYLVLHCPSTLDVLDDRGETPHDIILRSSNTELICVVNEILTSEKTTIKSQTRIDGLCYTEAETADSTVLWDVTNGEATSSEQQNQSENQLPLSSYSLDQQQKDCSYDEGYREATDGSFSGTDCSYSNDSSNRSDQHPSNTNLESENWIDDSISMDVRIPDSPTTAHVWSVLTRSEQPPDENARARMASLAQQIIDALPDRIKSDGPSVEDNCMEDMTDLSEPSSSGLSVHSKNPFLPNACMDSSAEWDELIGPFEHSSVYDTSAAVDTSDTRLSGPLDVLSSVSASPSFDSSSVSKNSATARAVGNNEDEKDIAHSSSAKALGEFFAADGVIGPLEKCFHDLRLTDREQRELYEAAKVIQHAFRQYKARISNQRQLEAERNAAVVIQSYYRRYKQFCYFKKLHKAAVLIQKHFRMHKSHQNSTLDIDNSTHNEDCRLIQDGARIENNADLLLKEHQAATLIQHAFRGHCQRKRQAAARTIQKFMRRSRQKLRKTHESNDDASTGISPTTHLTNGGSGSVHLSST